MIQSTSQVNAESPDAQISIYEFQNSRLEMTILFSQSKSFLGFNFSNLSNGKCRVIVSLKIETVICHLKN